ncbi:winged helix-turn-helix domain-containing protein [Streptomyces sp. ISL-66]|uniref:AfsR/SARP family transcriptional regulator n=1 Tax=Streptomyces sp. ISL-66 TaxID=2819186 RepID=UPI001BEA91EC|nr:BTAD domain-containing putative transcriptional regulator [Streptomyces sp. ISL-66]MBT2469732.1 winged helix-turn-helix domain-containing protein [Streptomyces sp. ISL-66]
MFNPGGRLVKFGVLGALRASDEDGRSVVIGGPKSRALLAVLLLQPNRTVPLGAVMEALWGEEQPATAAASLHNHLARLRRTLGGAGGTRLRTVAHGLELAVYEGELDSATFELLIRRAQDARHREDWAGAERDAVAALGMWRGTPFADVPGLGEHPVVAYLQEQRLQALECRFEALLHLDRLDGIAAELGVLVKEHPFRESLHRQLMLVLARTDRQAEALSLFRSLRRTLVEELGVEPGPAIQEAHREVLAAAPARSDRTARTAPRPRSRPQTGLPARAAQLPAPPGEFVGRAEQTAYVRSVLESDRRRTTLAVISGMPGVGKTGLALHVAEQLQGEFPDGQLYLNLHGASAGMVPVTPADALAVLLLGLGVDSRRIPCDVGAASALLRSAMSDTRTLLLLDDAASVSQVRPLLPAGAGCAVLITSRQPLATLGASTHVHLEPLSPGDSALLLERASGRSWTASDAESVGRLVSLCGRLPLALRVSAARLRSRRTLAVETLVERLDHQEDRLDHLELEDLSVRRSLMVAYEALLASGDPRDGDAAAVLVLVGALDLPEYGVPLIAAVMNTAGRYAERALERLAEVALLQETDSGRYEPHDLVRDFARELAGRPGERARIEEATARFLHWYREGLARCAVALRPDARRVPDHPKDPASRTCTALTDAAAALEWGDAEVGNLLFLAGQGADGRLGPSRTLEMINDLFPYLHDRGRVQDLKRLTRRAIALARSSGNTEAEGRALAQLATAHYSAGRVREALLLMDEAVALAERLPDEGVRMRQLGNRAALLKELGRVAEAQATLARCLELRPATLAASEEALFLGHQGYVAELTDLRLASSYHARSRSFAREAGDPVQEQVALCNLGRVHLALDEPEAALSCFEEALELMASSASHWNAERETRLGKAGALRVLGDLGQARHVCASLLQEAVTRGDSYGRGLAEHEYGHILRALGDEPAARIRWASALSALEGTDAQILDDLRRVVASGAS